MTARRVLIILTLAGLLVLLAWPAAEARYLGTDVWGNIAPNGGVGGLADRYPLSAYSLDYHVDGPSVGLGGVSTGDVPQTISHWLAAQLWALLVWVLKLTISLFAWAFSLDLINGQHGALTPVGNAVRHVYTDVLGNTWVSAAFIAAGLWATWSALVRRRYVDTFGKLAVSVACVVLALTMIFDPTGTVGLAARWSNDMSGAFLAGTSTGDVTDPATAKRQASDHLWQALVYEPWVVLEFGGLGHCVDTDHQDEHGYPLPVQPSDPARDVCRSHIRRDSTGHGGYAARFLAQPEGSDARNKEYEVLRDGELPTPATAQFANGYIVDKTDSPAVDIQQAGGAYQRLTLTVIVAIGSLGPILLIGYMAIVIIVAQALALVLFGFAAVMLIVGIFPGVGHDLFRAWLSKLGIALFVKAIYSLGLSMVLVVSAALSGATGALGFLFAFGLQTIFFWALFLYRKQIVQRLTRGAEGHQRVQQAIQRPVRGLAMMTVPVGRREQQEAAPQPQPVNDPPGWVSSGHQPPDPQPHPEPQPHPDAPVEHPPVKTPAPPRAFPPYQPKPEPVRE